MEVADPQSSSDMPVADFDEKLFQQFMSKNPVWDFILYQGMIIYVRVRLTKNNLFYNIIMKWKWMCKITFNNIFYYLLRCLSAFLNCFSTNLPSTLIGAWYMFSIVSRIIFDRVHSTFCSPCNIN